MKIGGFIKNSLIDYPGKISSVVFTQGCNLRCRYCHNPDLVVPKLISKAKSIPETFVFDYIKKNKKLLDAVVISGGEPTLQKDLVDFLIKVKSFNLLIKLDTNGTKPEVLNKLIDLNFLDFIALDIKAPLEIHKYAAIAGNFVNFEIIDKIKKSIWLILKSGIKHEFRTTVVKQILNKEDIIQICESIKGCDSYCLQGFSPEHTLDESFQANSGYSIDVLEWLTNDLVNYVDDVKVR